MTLQIPLTISGRDEHGSGFTDDVLTENVSKMEVTCSLAVISAESNRSELRTEPHPLSYTRLIVHVLPQKEHSPCRLSTGSEFEKWLGNR